MMSPEETKERILKSLNSPMFEALNKKGITTEYLAGKLEEELGATEIRVFHGKDGLVYSDPLAAHDIRQKARIDAHRLLGHYPADQHHFTGAISTGVPPEDAALLEEVKAILRERSKGQGQNEGSL